eukprot:CAMPEP_0184291698 /NCGR_PEP_ID=MMETSP1049-20130417/3632_1 /TAXON_ID=77928 /ORGANISM="Proteomonas sulcata, Strain CCMP704" /LENGTH=145 /DNA_ID=CAMNT_0026599205 /DNA_START=67 /DNA_END=501 /DNA_ORIENTATION=-
MGEAQSCLACDSKRQPSSGPSKRQPMDDQRVLASGNTKLGAPPPSDGEKARVGIGAYFQRNKDRNDILQVKSLLKGSPAQLCGEIEIGDTITHVNGERVDGDSLAQLAEKLLGPNGTPVECSFLKKESGQPLTVTLVRGINAEKW